MTEQERLAALRALEILDTSPEPEFDALVRAAALVCGVPVSLISLVDEHRQWFKARYGLPDTRQTPREIAFCDHAIRGNDIFEVPDATADARFATNPLVLDGPKIRFYAGVPLAAENGAKIGTLCVIGAQPKQLTQQQRQILAHLALAAQTALQRCHAVRQAATVTAALAQSEAESRALASRLQATLTAMDDGVLMLTPDLRVTYYNDRAINLLALDESLMKTSPTLQQVFAHQNQQFEYASFSKAIDVFEMLQTSQNGPYITTRPRNDGRVIELRVALVQGGGFVVNIADVTARVAADIMRAERDAAAKASRVKSEFLATMSHELRTPMSGMMGLLELLRATKLTDEQAGMLGMLHHSSSMLLAVLNDILDFSKIEAGILVLSPESVPLRTTIETALQPFAPQAHAKGLAYSISVSPDLPEWVITDPVRLNQIMQNLVSNAIKFTHGGEVSVTVSLLHAGGEPMLRAAVRDTGIGISQELMAQLFHPFVQADGSITREAGGTGLGLSIARRLALLLGGDLSVASHGTGSIFTLLLPLKLGSAPNAEGAPAPQPASRLPQGLRILVVDDDPTMRWLSQRQLELLGCYAEIAENGEAGLKKLKSARYDLLLTDCHMPRMDGTALARAVRASAEKNLATLPIIGLTADITQAQRTRCQESGMNDLAIKPLTLERLTALLHHHLAADGPAVPLPLTVPELRDIAFDDQMYMAIFEPSDREGTAWLREFLGAAQRDANWLANHWDSPPEDIVKTAHRLAGAAFSAGAILLGNAARALESAAQEGDFAAMHTAHDNLRDAFFGAQTAIEAFIEKLPAAA